MIDEHERYLLIAKREALKTQDCKRQFGAILVDNNTIIAKGRNFRDHPKIHYKFKPLGLHAEMHLLLRARKLTGTVYVYGQNKKSRNPVYSKPCSLCQEFLKRKSLTKIYFATKTGYEYIKL